MIISEHSSTVTEPIGSVVLRPTLIRDAVSSLTEELYPRHQSLVEKALENLAKNPKCYNNGSRPHAWHHVPNFTLSIPVEFLTQGARGKERYEWYHSVKICNLDPSTPLGAIVHKIKDTILECGFYCDRAEIHFEKGCMFSSADFWHKDGNRNGENYITVCYSNKPNWSTRIADSAKVYESLNVSSLDPTMITEQQTAIIDSVAFPAKHGDLWHANKVLHRGPKASDLAGDPLTPDDYRLLIRFS